MKRNNIFRILFLFFLISGIVARAQKTEPERILRLKNQLEDVSGYERMEVLEKLARFYTDTLSNLATSYARQYLKLAELNESYPDMVTAYRILASIQKYQVNYRLGLSYNFETLKFCRKLDDSSCMAIEQFRIGDNYTFLNQFDSAILYIDSAYQYFKNKDNSFQIFRANLQLGKAMCMHDENSKAVDYFLRSLKIANESEGESNIAWVEYWTGYCKMKLGDFDDAKDYLKSSISHYENSRSIAGKIGSQQALGELYLKTGDFASAYELFFNAYQELEYVKGDRGTKNYLCQYYVNMGEIYFNVGDDATALQYLDSAARIAHEINHEGKIALTNKHRGRVFYLTNNLDSAEFAFRRSLDHYQDENSKYIVAELLNELGLVYEQRKNYKSAISNYNKALEINRKIENKYGIAQNHINLSSCYMAAGNLQAIQKELLEGVEYAKQVNVDQLLLRYYKYAINQSEMAGNHKVAHEFFNKYIPLSEETNEKTKVNLSRLLVGLYTNKLAREVKIHNQQLELTKLEAQRSEIQKKQLLIISALILMILILIATLLINRIRTTKKLEKRVNERTRELKENEQKLIETNETKDRLYSIIAHDLKSPFNSLIGFSNLLHDEYDDFSEEERKQFIEIVRNNAEEIFALLENLLDWTRKSSQNMKFKPIKIDLQQIVKQTLQLQEKNAGLKKITIDNKIPKNTSVLADENMLRTIIRNLVSNAIKFTNEGGEITFSAVTNNGFVECSVSDNGVGMSQKTLDRLFDVSNNIKKKGTANEKGTGLGLLLCKDFVERNQGKLSIESRENVGSKFTFSLPEK